MMKCEFQSEQKTLVLTGKISIYRAAEMRKIFQESLTMTPEKGPQWNLDLSGCDSIDLAGLQVLISLREELKAYKSKLVLAKSCQSWDTILDLLGLGQNLIERAA